jgi:hypothetical protein
LQEAEYLAEMRQKMWGFSRKLIVIGKDVFSGYSCNAQ